MYRLLIVDDEEIEREGMADYIPWAKFEIELTGTARNGIEALEMMEKVKTDIVLTELLGEGHVLLYTYVQDKMEFLLDDVDTADVEHAVERIRKEFARLFKILVPVVKPALVTASIFAFYWIWQDFFQPLIFMSSPEKYTLSLALNMYLDPNAYNNYGALFAMSVLSLLPTLIFFIIFQRYLVDGIAMDGIKG